jgi:hypothetical protein
MSQICAKMSYFGLTFACNQQSMVAFAVPQAVAPRHSAVVTVRLSPGAKMGQPARMP